MEAFYEAFDRDCAEAGQRISARTMMERIAVSAGPRPAMLEALKRLRERQLSLAALTNNWATDDGETRIGSLMVMDFPDRQHAVDFITDEPYHRAGLFESVTIRAFLPAVVNPDLDDA